MTLPAVANLLQCFDSLGGLLHELDDSQWETQSLCPAWNVHGVVTHLTGIEDILTGWKPSTTPPQMFERLGPYMADVATWSHTQLLERYDTATQARRAELTAMSDAEFDAPSWTPVGEATYGRFMAIRTFDFWVHEQDIRVPLGVPGHLTGPAAEMALDEVRRSFGYIAGKKVGVPDGRSVVVELTGPVPGTIAATVVDGRAKVVPSVDAPDAAVTTDSLTFLLLACGRIDPSEPIADGRVTTAGDPELADRLARNLRFTF
jgi:uncharacterized protein (TIGR03083 family)